MNSVESDKEKDDEKDVEEDLYAEESELSFLLSTPGPQSSVSQSSGSLLKKPGSRVKTSWVHDHLQSKGQAGNTVYFATRRTNLVAVLQVLHGI